MTIKTSPSLLACNFLEIGNEVKRAEASGCDMLHCDVMDGIYVPNISFGFPVIEQISKITTLPLDVHMMTVCPQKYLEKLKQCGASSVTLHTDIMPEEHLIHYLEEMKSLGMKAAVALKPDVKAEIAYPFVPYCDMILVMTVEPGFGGQRFMENMLPKIRQIRDYCNIHKPEMDIQVDGGIGEQSIPLAAEAGANVFVIGTASFKAPDMKAALASLSASAREHFVM